MYWHFNCCIYIGKHMCICICKHKVSEKRQKGNFINSILNSTPKLSNWSILKVLSICLLKVTVTVIWEVFVYLILNDLISSIDCIQIFNFSFIHIWKSIKVFVKKWHKVDARTSKIVTKNGNLFIIKILYTPFDTCTIFVWVDLKRFQTRDIKWLVWSERI